MQQGFYGPMTLEEQVLYMEIAVALGHDEYENRERARNQRRETAAKIARETNTLAQEIARARRKVARMRYCKRNRAYGLGHKARASVRVRLTRQLSTLHY